MTTHGSPERRVAALFTVAPGSSVSAMIWAFTSVAHRRFRRTRPPAGRTSNIVSMEILRPDHHAPPMRRSGRGTEGAVLKTLTTIRFMTLSMPAIFGGVKRVKLADWGSRA
jgi:hypothetical protein